VAAIEKVERATIADTIEEMDEPPAVGSGVASAA